MDEGRERGEGGKDGEKRWMREEKERSGWTAG